ncbi:diphosphomevalonate/mevalonate 3,5-bisphosphate decarboxylase family protein [Blattabacterium cuenoti]|uniref:diphosphomevalonate/mevalonate 3,5-bisphosphate decarboxylase family protein n=1 Tax=Blattabacterium cuenoti TaxID=1653831 RepID=UPI00163CB454|nr:diphosphomevalonate decarboxylase [Blattabacterium cuenoti]
MIKKCWNTIKTKSVEGEILKKSPSNIALIKYWGKQKNKIQIPLNSSISYSLGGIYTVTKLIFYPRKEKKQSIRVFYSGKEKISFIPKILEFFKRISYYCSYLKHFNFIINTYNTFPHSSGLASSASSMSALALCIMEIEKKFKITINKNFFFKKASFLARLGSGSACRSVYSGLVVWGYHKSIIGSNNLYAIPYPYKIHRIFKNIRNTILIIDDKPKYVSSSDGHKFMLKNPYYKERIKCANKNMDRMIYLLNTGNFKAFGELIEYEALNLHAMMMTSNPYFLCMRPSTLKVLYKVWQFRKLSKNNVFFTLDAGANIHLLYPNKERKDIIKWIHSDLLYNCKKIINSYCK